MPRARDQSRDTAIEQRARHYSGPPCAAGHTLRHTVSRACVECQAEAQRQRRRSLAAARVSRTLGAMVAMPVARDDFDTL